METTETKETQETKQEQEGVTEVEQSESTQSPMAEEQQQNHIKGVIESLLFVNEKPVTLEQFKKVLETVFPSEIKKAIQSLETEYHERQSGMIIVEIAGGYQMLSNAKYASYIRSFYKKKHKERLSKPSLESLAIIAYKQPVTRSDIEVIRGVNSDGVVSHLLSKELIKMVGRKDVPGKPYLYGTTKLFLEYFGLKSLANLPNIEEFDQLKTIDDERLEENLQDSQTEDLPQEQLADGAASQDKKDQTEILEQESESDESK
ncbi:Segregation and condensation protein B [hydrothermal vent metagenome]|uniref:Segregation and condensation protein B n=1 Tax=hydrothermal vent metagenome TaxID=652676 RepID=A0A3B0TPE8_9ZZZZ